MRKLSRFQLLLTGLLVCVSSATLADTYPSKPIRLIVPYSPGGATDIVARLMSHKLTESLGQAVVVENRPGAGGIIGMDAVARADPDGYTLLLNTAGGHTLTPVLYKTNFDPVKSFAPISQIATIGLIVVTHPSVPAKTIKELVELAKSSPKSVSYAAGSSMITLMGEKFKSVVGAPRMISVPYKGTGPQLTAVMAGEVDMTFDPFNSLELIRAGKLRPLAVMSDKRSAALPDVPTLVESGIQDMNFNSWAALLAPAGTPQPIVDRLHRDVVKILQLPDVKQQLASIEYDIVGSTPAELNDIVIQDIARWTQIVKESGFKVDQ